MRSLVSVIHEEDTLAKLGMDNATLFSGHNFPMINSNNKDRAVRKTKSGAIPPELRNCITQTCLASPVTMG